MAHPLENGARFDFEITRCFLRSEPMRVCVFHKIRANAFVYGIHLRIRPAETRPGGHAKGV